MTGQLVRGCVAAAVDEVAPDATDHHWWTIYHEMEAAYQQAHREGLWRTGDEPDAIIAVWRWRHTQPTLLDEATP